MASPGTAGIAALGDDPHDDVVHPSAILFVAVHLACLGAFWAGVTLEALTLGAALYLLRMFGITAGYHRYFAHRAYKTSRTFQFILACLAQCSAQQRCAVVGRQAPLASPPLRYRTRRPLARQPRLLLRPSSAGSVRRPR